MKFFPVLSEPDLFLFRLRGAGLGNLLFPYFRAHCYAKEFNSSVIEPVWTQFKINQLRHVLTSRSRIYHNIFHPLTDSASSYSFERLLICLGLRSVTSEMQWIAEGRRDLGIDEVVLVTGHESLFEHLIPVRLDVQKMYEKMIGGRCSARVGDPYVALHIRMGDFSVAGTPGRNVQTNLSWFASVVALIARVVDYPVRICTDATSTEVQQILNTIPGSCIYRGRGVLDELEFLRGAKVLVSSASTFSMWAAILGDAFVVYNSDMFWAFGAGYGFNQFGFGGGEDGECLIKALRSYLNIL
jgi:hypothetical protein